MSSEQITPGSENTSSDDVTILGLEMESQASDVEKELYITGIEDFSARVVEFTKQISAQARTKGFALDERRLRSALDEALANAWKHGHGCDPEKPIILRWRFRNDLHIEVVDRGPGFDYRHLDDPTESQNVTKDFGRGLFVVRLSADHVRWTDGGRRIIFTFSGPDDCDRRKKKRIQSVTCLNIWQRGSQACTGGVNPSLGG
jgi:anti-sigma regulatory factor (Ser/Thr protein kinase)